MTIATFASIERQAAALQREISDARQHAAYRRRDRRGPIELAAEIGKALDPWQREALTTTKHDVLLLVTRQGGKGEVAALLALDALVNAPGTTTVIVSRAERQAKRLLRRVRRYYRMLEDVPPVLLEGQTGMELRNGSEILALPGSEETIRGIEAVNLLIVDEAALVDDELHASVQPMLAVSNGRTVALSTPRGKRGWFYREYVEGGDGWHRAKVTARDIPRIDPAWLERTRLKLGDWYFSQEFLCEFLDAQESLFASEDIAAALDNTIEPFLTTRVFG